MENLDFKPNRLKRSDGARSRLTSSLVGVQREFKFTNNHNFPLNEKLSNVLKLKAFLAVNVSLCNSENLNCVTSHFYSLHKLEF